MTLILVSKEEFFARVGPLNVNPRSERDQTFWEFPNRTLFGISTPGYLCQGEKTYRVVQK